ncbi:MAG: hypothetical protein NUV80_05020, partial [Candidatus Berkelbacteria bacterium]|nr:hypothetical protein [Candidatus Berkelbacteria bacterium]
MKAIAYSLFGYNNRSESCFDFDSYLTGLMLNIRMNRLVYPGWEVVVETDRNSYSAYSNIFDYLRDKGIIKLEINPSDYQLCQAMLWRVKPVYHKKTNGDFMYTHVLCRDLDGLSTYREAQAVKMWIDHDKTMHAMTDSTSHDVYLMGGMIGFNPGHFSGRSNTKDFNEFLNLKRMDFSAKGSDQTFLNQVVYPLVGEKGHDSITQHYFKGIGQTWLSDWHTCLCWHDDWRRGHKPGCVLDVAMDLPEYAKETDCIVEHIGSAGWNQQQTMRLIKKHEDKFQDLLMIEKQYP